MPRKPKFTETFHLDNVCVGWAVGGVIVRFEQERVYNGDTSNPFDQNHDYLINVIQ